MFTLTRLEDRIVFDASPVAVADAPDAANETPDSPEETERAVDKVLVVDMAVDNAEALASAARDDVQVVRYDSRTDSLARLQELIAEACAGSTFASIAFAGHGEAGRLFLASDAAIDLQTLVDNPDLAVFFEALSGYLSEGGRVDLLGCDVASGDAGEELIATLEELTGIDFAASDDPTGNADDSGDWLLETDDVDAAATYFDPDELEQFAGLLGDLDGLVDIVLKDDIQMFDDGDTIFKDGGLQIKESYMWAPHTIYISIEIQLSSGESWIELMGLPECQDPADAGSGFWIVPTADSKNGFYLDGSYFCIFLGVRENYPTLFLFSIEVKLDSPGYWVGGCHFPTLELLNETLSKLTLHNVGASSGVLDMKIAVTGRNNQGVKVGGEEFMQSHIRFVGKDTGDPGDPIINKPVIDDSPNDGPQIIHDPIVDDPIVDDSIVDDPIVDSPVVEDPIENDPADRDHQTLTEYADYEGETEAESETESATIEPVAWHFDVEEFGHSAGEIAERLEELTVDMRIDAPEVADTVEALAVFTSSIGAFNGHVDTLIALLPNLDPRALANSPELVRWIRSSSHQGETLTAQSRRCLERLGALGMAMRSSPQAARDPSGLQQLAAMGRFLDNVNVNMQASIAGMEIFLRRVGESDGDVDLNLLYQEIVDAENQTRTQLKSELLKRDSIYRLRQTRDAVRGSI